MTADAPQTQRTHAEYLISRGAHCVFTVKTNTPTLFPRLAQLDCWEQIEPTFIDDNKSHGRFVTRSLKACEVLLPGGLCCHDALQAIRLVRQVAVEDPKTGKKKTTTETVYVITDMDQVQAPAAKITAAIRGQWTC